MVARGVFLNDYLIRRRREERYAHEHTGNGHDDVDDVDDVGLSGRAR